MFKLNEKHEVDRRTQKSDYKRYSPSETSTINTPNGQIYINIHGKDSVNSLFGSLLRLNFDVLHNPTNVRYVEGDDIRFINLAPISLFSIYKLTSSSGKHLEETNHARIFCLMYKLITSSRAKDDLSIGFDRVRNRRQRELTKNKNIMASIM